MKPRIRLRFGIWSCRSSYLTFGGRVKVIGYGYSPADAYWDWQRQGSAN